MLRDFEHFFQREVLRGLQLAPKSAPRHGWPVFAVGSELLQAVVDAVEEDLVVDVLALRQEAFVHTIFPQLLVGNSLEVKLSIWACCSRARIFTALLPALLELQVQVEGQNRRQVRLEVLVAPDLRVLHLEKSLQGISAQWTIYLLHKLAPVPFDFLEDLIHVLLDREQIRLDALFLEELYRRHGPLLGELIARYHSLKQILHVGLEMGEEPVGDLVSLLSLVVFRLQLA